VRVGAPTTVASAGDAVRLTGRVRAADRRDARDARVVASHGNGPSALGGGRRAFVPEVSFADSSSTWSSSISIRRRCRRR
jgi:hypothetical protein